LLISSVPPLMVKTASNPGGLPKEVFDNFQTQVATNRPQFYYDVPAGPFYGYNRPGAKPAQGIIWNWWRQGMMGGAKAHYDGIVAFSQTDFTEDLQKITLPVLVMHGDDDQIVPYADSGPLSAKLLKHGTLKTYKGFPHGMPTTQAETLNADLLSFIQGGPAQPDPSRGHELVGQSRREEGYMTDGVKKNALTRAAILALLSDAEVAKVSTAEDARRLVEGDEYVDLENPGAGVRPVHAKSHVHPGHVLLRSAVSDATWDRVVRAVGR
jgi:Serine aminopeptidase, S33